MILEARYIGDHLVSKYQTRDQLTAKVPPVDLRIWVIKLVVSNCLSRLQLLMQVFGCVVVIEVSHLFLNQVFHKSTPKRLNLGLQAVEKMFHVPRAHHLRLAHVLEVRLTSC